MKTSPAINQKDDPWLPLIQKALLPIRIADGADQPKRNGQRVAAVLMPLVMRDEWHVILTQRPETMPQHPGQIAFPGGKREVGETSQAAALRETEEEIGITPDQINIIGRLVSFNAVSQFRVTPFVGIVDPTASITPDPHEVADVFEVPLAFLMDAKNYVARDVEFEGRKHRLWYMLYDGPDGVHRNIWGMTAMMIYRLYQRSCLGLFETDY